MKILKEFLNDCLLSFKFIFVLLYSVVSLWFKNLFIPSRYLYKKVDNEIALITGAASGIGKLLAKRFLSLKSTVICVDINESELNKTINEFKRDLPISDHQHLFSYTADVASYEQMKSLVKQIKRDVGDVTILVNNAGIMNGFKLLTDLSEDEIRRIFDVNILAQFWLCKEIVPSMVLSNKGHIVNISSICGFMGGERVTDYCSTKFAVYGLSESLRVELKNLNKNNKIIVTTVCPCHVKTKMFEMVKFNHFNWLGLSMEPEYVCDEIIHGILLDKKLIYVPKLLVTICSMFKGFSLTEFNDHAISVLSMNATGEKEKNK